MNTLQIIQFYLHENKLKTICLPNEQILIIYRPNHYIELWEYDETTIQILKINKSNTKAKGDMDSTQIDLTYPNSLQQILETCT